MAQTKWPSGAELLGKGTDPETVRKVVAAALAAAKRARGGIVPFFNFVMRAESGNASGNVGAKRDEGAIFRPGDYIRAAAHQRVHLDFVMGHRRSVSMAPRDHAKSTDVAAITLYKLGTAPHLRGAIISATQGQSEKTLRMVADYILHNPRVQLAFPHLRPTGRKNEPWTQTAITVDRPAGIRDPSLVALGYGGAVLGRRLDWIIVDDLLDDENVSTEEQRKKLIEWVSGTVQGCLTSTDESMMAVLNTAWHPDDLLHHLMNKGWATLRMQVDGNIEVRDDSEPYHRIEGGEQWDHPDLVPGKKYPFCRLKAHEPDPGEKQTLWPERWPPEAIDRIRRDRLPHVFNQHYMQIAFDYSTAMCKPEWIELCKKKARERGVYRLLPKFDWQNNPDVLVFSGMDLAIQVGEHNDDTAIFTIGVHPDGCRQILDVEAGKWNGPEGLLKVRQKVELYGCHVVRVENNAAQDFFRQFALDQDASLPVKPHTTTAMKSHPELGIPGLFLEIMNGAWLIPNDKHGDMHPAVERFVRSCIQFVPDKHTDDVLMAAYFAQQQAREWGLTTRERPPEDPRGGGLESVMDR